MTIKIDALKIELENVEYEYTKAEPMTREYPGASADVEIHTIWHWMKVQGEGYGFVDISDMLDELGLLGLVIDQIIIYHDELETKGEEI